MDTAKDGSYVSGKYNATLYCNLSNTCNFDCEYCWGIMLWGKSKTPPINILRFVGVLNHTHRIVNVLFSGEGEPFLIPNIVEASIEIVKQHYLSFNTNFVHSRIVELLEVIDPERIVWITASLHLKELEIHGLLDTYIRHFQVCQRKNIPIFSSAVGHPSLLPKVAYYKDYLGDKGISFSFNPFFGNFNGKQYPEAYTEKEMEVFELRSLSPYNMKGKLCNAGYNHAFVNSKGEVRCCNQIELALGTLERGFRFKKKLIKCPLESCSCPIREFEPELFKAAARETGNKSYKVPFYPLVVTEMGSYRHFIPRLKRQVRPYLQWILPYVRRYKRA